MIFKGIKKIHQGRYINRYDISYENRNGENKEYEIISRNPDITSFEELHDGSPDAVVIIMHDNKQERVLLNREFRMAMGEWIYNFPAGMIDEGETVDEAAKRELREETGLCLEQIDEVWKESYSAVGFSNEKTVVVVGTASGDILSSDSDMEEIEAAWYTRDEVRSLLETERFAARTQAYCVLWSRDVQSTA